MRLHRRLRLRGRESAAMVERLDERQIGVELRVGERLAVAQAQAGLELDERNRGVAGDDDAVDAVLRSLLDGERHQQLAVRLRPRVRRGGVAITLPSQILLDAVARILEQVFVGGAFALDRHELGPLIRRQRIAGEHDAHVRAAGDVQRDVRDAIVGGQRHGRRDFRLVVPALAQALDRARDEAGESVALVRRRAPRGAAARAARRAACRRGDR